MASSKLVYDGEWVRVRNMMNKRFTASDPRCEWCLRLTCDVVWLSIKTHRVRCRRCFTPKQAK